MKRFILAAAMLGTLFFAATPAAEAQPYFYRRPYARIMAPPYVRPYYGPRYYYGYGPRYYGPRYYGPRMYGPGFGYYGFGPRAYVGFGIY